MFENLALVAMLILYAAVISIPGFVIALLGWRLSRGIRPVSVQTFFRAGLIATAVTPTIYGHAGPVPAILPAVVEHGRDKMAGIVPILVVWVIAIAIIGARAKSEGFRLRYLDEMCAWLIFLGGLIHIVLTDLFHLQGTLDTALVWVFVAMLNLLRIKNGYSVRRLKVFCVVANLSTLMLEAVRWKMFEDPFSVVLVALILIESVFSITPKAPTTNPQISQATGQPTS